MRRRGAGFVDDNKPALEGAYEATAVIGKVYTIIGTIVAVLFGTLFLVTGVFIVRMKEKRTEKAIATVKSVECTKINTSAPPDSQPRESIQCRATIVYKVGEKEYTKDHIFYKPVTANQSVEVLYDPKNPTDISETAVGQVRWLGWLFIAIGVTVITIALVYLYFALTYKPLAAVAGVGVLTDAIVPDGLQ
jgi:hypothetical protein